jgi:OFA family oxalate/formate antiporter-like MFS transporter
MLTSGIIITIYGLAVYLASISNFYGFVITMGVVSGFCVGNEYLIPVDNAYYYYPERKGLMSGLILCGLGFSAVVFNPLV